MKKIEKGDRRAYFQGDCLIIRAPNAKLPAGAQRIDSNIIAHSETGHHHVAVGADVIAGPDPMVLFMKSTGSSVQVKHLRDWDTHETYEFFSDPGEIFIVKRQRESTPEGWRRVED